MHIEHDGEYALYMLFIGDAIVSAVATQARNTSTYIQYVDSTGLERGHTGRFVAGILSSVQGLVVCFSRPHPEPILGRSSANSAKKVRSPPDLLNYWTAVFQARCSCAALLRNADGEQARTSQEGTCGVRTWSNFRAGRSYPYRSMEEIELFEDDPVSKMARNMAHCPSKSIGEVFAGLLVRSDFADGGLLFSQCFCPGPAIQDQAGHIKEYLQRIPDGSSVSRSAAEAVPVPPRAARSELQHAAPGRIAQIIGTLRHGDFSSGLLAARETAQLLSRFGIRLEYFQLPPAPCKTHMEPREDTVARLVPRKRPFNG